MSIPSSVGMVDNVSSRVEVFDEPQNVTSYHCSNDEGTILFEVNYERGSWWLHTDTSKYAGWLSSMSYIEGDDSEYRCAVHEAAMRVDRNTYAFNFVLYFDKPVYVLDTAHF